MKQSKPELKGIGEKNDINLKLLLYVCTLGLPVLLTKILLNKINN